MRILKQLTFALFVALSVTPLFAKGIWETDFEKASAEAKASNKYMLLDFTGSDWCGWCVKLDNEVFSESKFKKYAKGDLVCVLVDFPRKKLSKKQSAKNDVLAKKYRITGYPSIIILTPDGKKIEQTGYLKGGAKEYVKHLKGIIDPHRAKNPQFQQQAQLAQAKTPVKALLHETRTWISKSGTTITAKLSKKQGAYVVLQKENGSTLKILKSKLCAADRKYLSTIK